MAEQEQSTERKRRDWVIILIILLFGLLCVTLAGGRAIRFAPTWKLDTDMGSNIDPNSDFLTNRPNDFLEPLDPSILTQPAWINIFLTPGAIFPTKPPVTSLPTNTPLATNTTAPKIIVSPTNTAITPSPANTFIYIPPPPTNTSKPPPPTNTPKPPPPTNTPKPPPPTNTPKPPPPATPVDFSITKTDGVTTYAPGSTLTYTVVVTNNSSVNVNGVTINDTKPSQVTTWGWCVTPCTPSANTNTNLNTTANLAAGNSITYSILANIDPGATGDLVNTASVSVPSGYIDTNNGNNSATDTDTIASTADLQITKDDGDTDYIENDWKIYTITVTNVGPSDVAGATVTDVFSSNTNLNYSPPTSPFWICIPASGASCTLAGTGDINQTVDLPAGSSVTYIVTVQTAASPSGSLVNTATVTAPAGITDPVPGNNSATDSDNLVTATDISTTNLNNNDGNLTTLSDGDTLTISLATPVVVGSHAGYDLIYYERNAGGSVNMDWVILELGDGSNWYTILNWNNGVADTNTNVSVPLVGNGAGDGPCTGEPDNCNIDGAILVNTNGITIEVDGIGIPSGSYPYLRITALVGGDGDGVNIDAIYVVP